MSNSNRKISYFDFKSIIVLLALTQVLGLLPATLNTKSRQLKKSKFVFCHYILISAFFTIVHPMTIYKIFTKTTQLKGTSDFINRSYFVIIYVLCVLAYLELWFKSNIRIKILSDFFRTADLVTEIRSDIVVRNNSVLWVLFRICYLYFGNVYLVIAEVNLIEEAAKSLSFLDWVSLFLPFSIASCGMLWAHALTVIQINNVRKMRKGFSDCIHMANGSIGLAPAMRHIICCQANDTFDKISKLYTICFDLYRVIMKKSSIIIMAILIKIILNMITVVSIQKKIVCI